MKKAMVTDDLQSLGRILQQTREARALSLEEVEMQTRIRAKYLQALESGDLSALPSVAHAKGFLRNYAQFLRLDANQIVERFARTTGTGIKPVTTLTATQQHRASPPLIPAAPRSSDSGRAAIPSPVAPPSSSQSYAGENPSYVAPDQRVGPGVPLGMAGPVQIAQPLPERHRPSSMRLLQSNIFAGAVLIITAVVIVWLVTTQLRAVPVENVVPTAGQSDVLRTAQARNSATPSPTFEPTSTPVATTGPLILDRVLLTITIEQRSWTRIVVDGQTAFEGQVEEGMVLQYEGRESILVLTGNGAALAVTYNHQYIGLLGERGEVVERLFTPGGQITPTPTPTLTPTGTSVPTPTPNPAHTPTPGD